MIGLALVFVIIIIIAVIAAPHFIKIDAHRIYIQSFIESATGKDIDIGKIGLSLWRGFEIYMVDIQIKEKNKAIIQPIFKAKRISAKLKILPLFKKKIRLRSIIVHSPEIVYYTSEENPFNALLFLANFGTVVDEDSWETGFGKIGKKMKSSFLSGFSFDTSSFGKVKVRRGRIHIKKKIASGEMLSLGLEKVFLDIAGFQSTPSLSIEAKASFTEDSGYLKLKGTVGTIQEEGGLPLNIFLETGISNSHIFSKSLSSLIGIGIEKGQLKMTSEIGGMIGRYVSIQGNGQFEDLSLKSYGPEAYLNKSLQGIFSFKGEIRETLLDIEEIKIHLGPSVVTINGKVDLKNNVPRLKFDIKGEDISYIDLDNLLPLVGFQLPYLVKGGKLNAHLHGSLQIGSLSIKQLSGDAFIEGVEIMMESIPATVKNLECQVKISKNSLDISSLDATFQDSKINGNIHIASLEPPESTFALEIFGGQVMGRLSSPQEKEGSYSLNVDLKEIDLNSLISIFSPPNRDIFYGNFEAQMQLKGKDPLLEDLMRNLSGVGNFKAVNGRITTFGLLKQVSIILNLVGGKGIGQKETPFEFLEGQFHLDNGILEMKNLFLKSSDIDLHGDGRFQFDSSIDFSFDAIFSPEVSKAMVASMPVLRHRMDSSGNISIPLRISGNMANPKVLINIDDIIKKSAKEKFFKKIKNLFQRR